MAVTTDTAGEVINAAFSLALSNSADIPLEADEMATGITQLNNLIASWNLTLGYTVVGASSDVLTVQDYAIEAMTTALAIKLSPGFGQVVSPDLRENARQSKKDLLKIVITIKPSIMPQTLPQGAGNNNTFYPPRTV